MTSLCNINPDGACDGQQWSLEDFSVAEVRNAASGMLDILAGTKNKTAAEVSVEIGTDAPKLGGLKVLYTMLAANTAGRAQVIVREDAKKNGSWTWTRLRDRFGRDSGALCFTEVFQYSWPNEKPFDDVWHEWVKVVSKLPQGSLSSHAIEQLTITGLSRHGQPKLENHLRLNGMARHSVYSKIWNCF